MNKTTEFIDNLYKTKKDLYTSESEGKFKELLEEEFEVDNNPKKDDLYSICYDLGHSAGYYEIYGHYISLVELIK